MLKIKEQLLQFCWDGVDARTASLKKRGDELRESLNSETKSSAGDKHETGRAMVQLEQEKLGKQLLELEKKRAILQKVDIAKTSAKIVLGSLIKTSLANYFIAISAGAFQKEGVDVFCISPNAPIAQLLLGKEQGDTTIFNGKKIEILEVL
ncbi:3-oxoacyl-ACP synthase [Flagellimonas onchidii]|uniref:3-oxoacyl-ACP synthase n=1 Tax=Flagellimonas onchidii TaxID=2562684 RepID=UPI001F0DBE72|nr:3-oxoacyl-ACP synthase [Allomuricauda onchidii]